MPQHVRGGFRAGTTSAWRHNGHLHTRNRPSSSRKQDAWKLCAQGSVSTSSSHASADKQMVHCCRFESGRTHRTHRMGGPPCVVWCSYVLRGAKQLSERGAHAVPVPTVASRSSAVLWRSRSRTGDA